MTPHLKSNFLSNQKRRHCFCFFGNSAVHSNVSIVMCHLLLLSALKLQVCCCVLPGGASGLELKRWPNWLNPRKKTLERGGVTLTRMESKRKNEQRAHQTSLCLPHLHSFPLKYLLPFPIGLQMTSRMDLTPTVTITTTLAPLALDLWVRHSLP